MSYGVEYGIQVVVMSVMSCISCSEVPSEDYCLDFKGEMVEPGHRYFPLGTDPCMECTCRGGKPEMCISVFCAPPENCHQFHAVNEKCCEFVCLDGVFDINADIRSLNTSLTRVNGDNYRNPGNILSGAHNLGLRLIASTITSFLILALLLFMIHRLRQRRLLLMIRRLQTRRLEHCEHSSAFGYFTPHEPFEINDSFNEPPPPYTYWKPSEQLVPPGEAPPPYEDAVDRNSATCFVNSIAINATHSPVNRARRIITAPLTIPVVSTTTTATSPICSSRCQYDCQTPYDCNGRAQTPQNSELTVLRIVNGNIFRVPNEGFHADTNDRSFPLQLPPPLLSPSPISPSSTSSSSSVPSSSISVSSSSSPSTPSTVKQAFECESSRL